MSRIYRAANAQYLSLTLHKTTVFTDREVKVPSGSFSCSKESTNDPEVSSAFVLTGLASLKTHI